jgi:murein DD-endopeptidase MepM/ murein hydrolase activator NlpD
MQATSIAAPDKIFVGQRVVIPGRPDLLAAMDEPQLPPDSPKLPVDSSKPVLAEAAPEPLSMHPHAAPPSEIRVASIDNSVTPVMPLADRIVTSGPVSTLPPTHNALTGKPAAKPALPAATATAPATRTTTPAATQTATAPAPKASAAPAQVATVTPPAAQQPAVKMPLQEPAMSGADKFRWPVNGKVIVDFASSHGTGINIAAPEGAPIKAAENGTVIYVGSGVEGYGNLILIRHANGFVSAYANLKDMGVAKGAVVNRGDVIGSAGTTGSVNSPQLHFELRKGATPVDPVPLLAG